MKFFDKQISLVAGVSKVGVMRVNACFEELRAGRKVPARVPGLKKRLVLQDVKGVLRFLFFPLVLFSKGDYFGFYIRAKRG